METAIVSLAEKTVLGAGFFYLLYYLIQNMGNITKSLESFGVTLTDVSKTMLKIDMRMEQIETRVRQLEDKF